MFPEPFLERFGNLVAPDEKFRPNKASEEKSIMEKVWNFVAPRDPAYEEKISQSQTAETESMEGESPEATTPVASAGPVPPLDAFSLRRVTCIHCNKMTPVKIAANNDLQQENGFKTPSPTTNTFGNSEDNDENFDNDDTNNLNQAVLLAAKATAESFASPPAVNEHGNKVFRLCASSKPLADKLTKKLRNLLTKYKSLQKARATKLGELVPDSYTPLMACAHAGNVGAAKVIMEIDKTAHLDRDLKGRTPLHIAADLGHVEVVNAIKERHIQDGQSWDSNVDLVGRTPLGTCLTSPNPRAQQNRSKLQQALFSPTDISIIGSPPPTIKRQKADLSLNMAYATSEMPGYRVAMEDAVCSVSWVNDTTGYCLLGICDGHGDQGKVSKYVATKIVELIQEKTVKLTAEANWPEIWADACFEVDKSLKETGLLGGSTGVFALVTKNDIIVANVGDSRCILVQRNTSTSTTDGEETPPLIDEGETRPGETDNTASNGETSEGDEEKEALPLMYTESHTASVENTGSGSQENRNKKSNEDGPPEKTLVEGETPQQRAPTQIKKDEYVVVTLSQDHKPSLGQEKNRIESAGLTVIPETFIEDDKEVTIHKVQKNSSNRLAVSRSFGDFEYKANKDLSPAEQAVTAEPEIRVHRRNAETDMFMVLACDGIWDVMTNEEVGKFVAEEACRGSEGTRRGRLSEIGDELLKECLRLGSKDNMTVAIAALSKSMEEFPGGSMAGKSLFKP